jgi:beta-lactamase regulating signal transducer with metallopeptidase domain
MNALDAVLAAGLVWLMRATILLVFAWLLTIVLRRTTAALRHLVWVAGFAAAIALPLASAILPWRWQVPVSPTSAVSGAAREPRTEAVPVAATGSLVGAARRTSEVAASVTASVNWLSPLLLATWLGGTFLALASLVVGARRLRRLVRRSVAPRTPGWQALVARIARRAALARPVDVLESPDVSLPLTTGVVRPVVLLPAGAATDWPASRLEAVLVHEFAHVRRNDLVGHLLGRIVCAMQWFNPMSWFAVRRLVREAERSCDDEVLQYGARPSTYAEHLLDVLKAGRGRPVPAPALSMARRADLEGRVLALLDPETRRGRLGRRVGALVALGAVGVVVLVALPSSGAGEQVVRRSSASVTDTENVVVTALLELLEDQHYRVREAAARALGDRRASDAVPALLRALSDSVDDVREEVAVALGFIGDPSAIAPLARLLSAWALGETETHEAVVQLARALERVSDTGLRHEIVEALGETGQPAAVEVLVGLLRSADTRLQQTVLASLVEIGSDDAMRAVIDAMRSDDAGLRRLAARALGEG